MKTHELKCHPHFFEAITDGTKTFEIRRNDRHYAVGDVIDLLEWNPAFGFTKRSLKGLKITYLMSDEDFPGIQPGYVIMGLHAQRESVGGHKRDMEVAKAFREEGPIERLIDRERPFGYTEPPPKEMETRVSPLMVTRAKPSNVGICKRVHPVSGKQACICELSTLEERRSCAYWNE